MGFFFSVCRRQFAWLSNVRNFLALPMPQIQLVSGTLHTSINKKSHHQMLIHTDDGVTISIWALAEFQAGLIAANIPPLKSRFEWLLKRVFNVRSGLSSSGTPRSYAMQTLKGSRLNESSRHHSKYGVNNEAEITYSVGNSYCLRHCRRHYQI